MGKHDPFTIRTVRRLASGDVEVTAILGDLRRLVVVVPYARSGEDDIKRALSLALRSRQRKSKA